MISGLEEDKLDVPISIRGAGGNNRFYNEGRLVASGGAFTTTCGFRPKAIYLRAYYEDSTPDTSFSQTYTIEESDGTLTTSGIYRDTNTMYSLGTGDSSSIDAIRIQTWYFKVTGISDTGFTLGDSNMPTFGNDVYLYITVFG